MVSIPINGSPRFTDTEVNGIDGTSGDWQFELGDNNLYVVNKKDNKNSLNLLILFEDVVLL